MEDENQKELEEALFGLENNIPCNEQLTPERKEENRLLAQKFERKRTQKRKTVFWRTSLSAASVIIVGLIITFVIINWPKGPGDPTWRFEDLEENPSSIAVLADDHGVILPENFNEVDSKLFTDKNTGQAILARILLLDINDQALEVFVVFVKNLSFEPLKDFAVAVQLANTEKFDFLYLVETNSALARFTYQDKRYYVKLNSNQPSNIIKIINSFA